MKYYNRSTVTRLGSSVFTCGPTGQARKFRRQSAKRTGRYQIKLPVFDPQLMEGASSVEVRPACAAKGAEMRSPGQRRLAVRVLRPRVSRTGRRFLFLSWTFPLLAACLLQAGCGRSSGSGSTSAPSATTIQNKGSDTMVNLAQAWAEEYKKAAADVDVEVSGGGSGVGIAALEKGAIDIANASRNMKPGEIETAKRNTGKAPKEFIVGYDALAIYVHKENPLNEITLDQLAQIYAEGGTVTKWTDLGVQVPGTSNQEIVRVSRQSSSGTYEFLREHVLHNKDYKLGSRDMNGSKEVVELVASTPTAIGYSGMGYATPAVKMLKIKKSAADPAYEPSVANTLAKTYPIARSLQIYTLGEPQGAVKTYIDWILSDAGQKVVEVSGYVPLPNDARRRP